MRGHDSPKKITGSNTQRRVADAMFVCLCHLRTRTECEQDPKGAAALHKLHMCWPLQDGGRRPKTHRACQRQYQMQYVDRHFSLEHLACVRWDGSGSNNSTVFIDFDRFFKD